jgi:DNA-binding beta-propeller fold protein YncE
MDAAGLLIRVAGNGSDGNGGDGGPATEALLNFPELYPELARDDVDFWEFLGAVAVDSEGNLFIADAYNDRIRKVDTSGIIVTVAGAGMGSWRHVYDLRWPQGIAVDADGSLYVSTGDGILIKIPREGPIEPPAGWRLSVSYPVSEGIALDSDSNIYVADGACTIKKVDRRGTNFPAIGRCAPIGGGDEGLWGPYSVALDSNGVLFVADTYNNCIRRLDGTGVMKTIAGTCGWETRGFSGDGGPATDARFYLPFGIALDKMGNVYIADSGNNRVRKIDGDGLVTTVAGNGESLPRP